MAGFEFHEKGQVNHQGDDGENHAAHGTDGKREPEDLFRTFVYKRNQAQNSGSLLNKSEASDDTHSV
ncbi:MAG: hypothetical protein K2P54_06695, partial [Odoribacter sp.]|nr:hypothetical protein [Odoribacter sp.]